MKYSDQIAGWLVELGYTHCFYVGGGNIMHLVESFSRVIKCIPVIHEVGAGIAAEYFNQTSDSEKALALVTAGPGLTNIITAMAGSYLESRELLVIGGQVKTSDLSHGKLRQNGIQEIDGVSLAATVCVESASVIYPWDKDKFTSTILLSSSGRKGPVFLEVPLDIQAKDVDFDSSNSIKATRKLPKIESSALNEIASLINNAKRPIIMLGGGVDRKTSKEIYNCFAKTSVPIATTWNGADRIDSNHPNYIGRPNTWGQRSANILVQQSDLLIAVGTRLGMQQTGFNWQEFLPLGDIIQIDIDESELHKGHPEIAQGIAVDANDFLIRLMRENLGKHTEWLQFCKEVRTLLPNEEESANSVGIGYVSPHKFIKCLSTLADSSDIIIPCSSGGAFTTMYQMFEQKFGQKMVSDKSLASMGYGLSGAIGASLANPDKRVVLVEGDGGFSQNLQEIGTAAINNCNLKVFIFDDEGHASIRMTQRSYFGGKYVGCDIRTGLGLPIWERLFHAWDIESYVLDAESFENGNFEQKFNVTGFTVFIVKIDPEQTYYPKILSKVTDEGSMVSNPIHIMSPPLGVDISEKVFKYIDVTQ